MAPRTKVGSHVRNKTHDLSLYDGRQTFGFRYDGDPSALSEDSASTIQAGGGQGEFGDGDPHFRNIEQTSWRDGAGQERHQSLAEGFADSMNAFTMKEKVLFPAPLSDLATGIKTNVTMKQPGDMGLYPLHSGNKRYISDTWTQSGNLTADKVYLWIRRIGSPGTLTIAICANSGGSPSTVLQSATVTTSTVTDVVSVYQVFDWASTEALTNTTVYHIKASAAAADNAASHWEIGVDIDGATGKTSTNDSTWSAGDHSIYFRVVPADVKMKMYPFELLGGHYVVQIFKNTGTASKVFLQGVRGEATSVTATTTTDSALAMTADEYIGATLLIVEGPGTGEYQTITDNDATSFTHAAFDTTLTAASNFVVLGSTKYTEIAEASGLGAVTGRPVVLNDVAYFPQGNGTTMRRLRWRSDTKVHQWADDSTNKADLLSAQGLRGEGPKVWRARNKLNGSTTVSKAPDQPWGTDLTFGTARKVGGFDGDILDMVKYDNSLWVLRNDQPYVVTDDKAVPTLDQMAFIAHPTNGLGSMVHDVMLNIPWAGFTLQQFYGGSLSDISRKRVPSGRGGHYASGISHPVGMFWGIDAGPSGTSAVWFRGDDRLGWHEVYRAFESGKRIQSIWCESNLLMRPKLWINVGDDLVYQEWPQGTLDPLRDSGMNYAHEAVVELAPIDGGAISLPKYIEDVKITSKNLTASGIQVMLDYQLDEDVDSSTLTTRLNVPEEFTVSPEQTQKIDAGDVRLFKPRLRLITNDADVPPIVEGIAIKAQVRTTFKRRWVARVTISDSQKTYRGQKDFKPEDIVEWILDVQGRMQQLNMRTTFADIDDLSVAMDNYKLQREWQSKDGKKQGAILWLILKEA